MRKLFIRVRNIFNLFEAENSITCISNNTLSITTQIYNLFQKAQPLRK